MKIRLIAMDMDGTLLDNDTTRLPAENAAALREAAEAGIHIAICSGRNPDDISMYALDAGLPQLHILALNGGCIMDRPMGTILRSDCISPDTSLRLMRRAHASGLLYGCFRDHVLAIDNGTPENQPVIRWGYHLLRPEGLGQMVFGAEAVESMARQGFNKLVLLDMESTGVIPSLKKELESDFPELELCASWTNNIEANPRGINKGSGLKNLADSLGIPMEQVMAIGDHDNDLPMLRAAGVSVVMENGSPAALATAHWMAPANTRYGVADAIRFLALGDETLQGVKKLK